MLYTEEIHAERLLEVLLKNEPCNHCIASENFDEYGRPWKLWDNETCQLCTNFVGLEYKYPFLCPCHALGHEKAIEKSWEALREKGYMK